MRTLSQLYQSLSKDYWYLKVLEVSYKDGYKYSVPNLTYGFVCIVVILYRILYYEVHSYVSMFPVLDPQTGPFHSMWFNPQDHGFHTVHCRAVPGGRCTCVTLSEAVLVPRGPISGLLPGSLALVLLWYQCFATQPRGMQ